ncbi:hypothetical protein, partial [Streptomyces pinistramenti]|uniref:hypothetical protein n=1 Tax=Streptomyces pinistramenti TaxID=2884812 RepID=UPI001D07D2BE
MRLADGGLPGRLGDRRHRLEGCRQVPGRIGSREPRPAGDRNGRPTGPAGPGSNGVRAAHTC